MTTWADLLKDLRTDLQDEAANPRWSDRLLYLYAKDGIRDYSVWFPKRVDNLALTVKNGAFPLPADYIEDIHVECPAGFFLSSMQVRPNTHRLPGTSKFANYYYIQGGNLYLGSPTSDDLALTYLASHAVPASETDATFELTIPDADLELVRLYVKAKVYSQMRSRQASLDRFKVGSGKRDDNPLAPEVDDVWADYNKAIISRTNGGVILLYRLRR
jgi:hypothetical protein